MKTFSYRLSIEFSNNRLDKVLTCLLPDISRSRIQKAIKENYVKVNNIIISDSACKVKDNDLVEIILIEPTSTEMHEANISLDVIYEDQDLIVINKPAGLTVHPGAGNHQDTLANALLYHSKTLSDIGGDFRPGIVHRLDKDTSGLMIVAKNNESHVKIAKQIERRELIRKYKALIWGVMIPHTGTIQINIGRDKFSRQKMTALKVGGKDAITHYYTQEIFLKGAVSLVECKLQTGRTHQIRVHLSHAGHSIVGDQIYGHNNRKSNNLPESLCQTILSLKRQALHSYYIGFVHPKNNHFLEFSVALPTDIYNIINTLKCHEI